MEEGSQVFAGVVQREKNRLESQAKEQMLKQGLFREDPVL
jgi:hypothetical protein